MKIFKAVEFQNVDSKVTSWDSLNKNPNDNSNMKGSVKILFIEDVIPDAELIWKEIADNDINFTKQLVETREDYIIALTSFVPDLIISDSSLPNFDGLQALNIRNEIAPLTPFIFVTDPTNEETAVKCMKSGADDYLIKNNLSQLGPAIKNALRIKEILRKNENIVCDAAEQTLRESYNFNGSLLKTIPFGMQIVDEEGNIIFQNENFQNKFVKNSLGKKCWEVYRDDKTQCEGCPLLEGIKIGVTSTYEVHDVLGRRIFDVSHTGMMFEGKKAMLEIFQEITERKLLEEKIIESEAYHRTLIDILPDCILTIDLAGKVTYCSLKAYDIFKIPMGAMVIGTSVLDWVEPGYHQMVINFFEELNKGEIVYKSKEYKLRRYDGSIFWGELASSLLKDSDNNPTSLLVVCRDISLHKQIEDDLTQARDKAEESDCLKSSFLNNMSHEIRTPLNAIVGFTNFLGDPEQSPEKIKQYIDIIQQNSHQLLSIISDVLDIATIEAGQEKSRESETNLNVILRNIYDQFNFKLSNSEIDFNYTTSITDSEASIITDESKLMQILSNLIGNALKFTERGKVEFGFSIQDEEVLFYCQDTGIGISHKYHDKIFERFWQVDTGDKRRYGGNGLGLSITKFNVELLGGKIWLESEPGIGSTFYFTLPHKTITEFDEIYIDKELIDLKSSDKTILIAEDDELNYFLINEMLLTYGVKVLHARNGYEAVEIIKINPQIDIVLMDIKMPIMNGYEATMEIKKMKSEITVIAQSALVLDCDREKAFMAGCDEYLAKPLKKDKLMALLSKHLKKINNFN